MYVGAYYVYIHTYICIYIYTIQRFKPNKEEQCDLQVVLGIVLCYKHMFICVRIYIQIHKCIYVYIYINVYTHTVELIEPNEDLQQDSETGLDINVFV